MGVPPVLLTLPRLWRRRTTVPYEVDRGEAPHPRPYPKLRTLLSANEELVIEAEASGTTATEGPGGCVILRQWQWDALTGWKVKDEFLLGSAGRQGLARFLSKKDGHGGSK